MAGRSVPDNHMRVTLHGPRQMAGVDRYLHDDRQTGSIKSGFARLPRNEYWYLVAHNILSSPGVWPGGLAGDVKRLECCCISSLTHRGVSMTVRCLGEASHARHRSPPNVSSSHAHISFLQRNGTSEAHHFTESLSIRQSTWEQRVNIIRSEWRALETCLLLQGGDR